MLTWYEGMVVRVRARGVYTMGSTATNATFALVCLGDGHCAVRLAPHLATTRRAGAAGRNAVTGLWRLELLTAEIQCRAIAQATSTPSLYTHGEIQIQTATPSGTTGNVQVWPMPATAGPTAADVDTTIAHTLGLVGTLSQATGSPSITCTVITAPSVAGYLIRRSISLIRPAR